MAWDTEGTRRRLRDAALVEFAARGFDGTTVGAIAARAGVNKERLYSYFGDKKALWELVLATELERLASAGATHRRGIGRHRRVRRARRSTTTPPTPSWAACCSGRGCRTASPPTPSGARRTTGRRWSVSPLPSGTACSTRPRSRPSRLRAHRPGRMVADGAAACRDDHRRRTERPSRNAHAAACSSSKRHGDSRPRREADQQRRVDVVTIEHRSDIYRPRQSGKPFVRCSSARQEVQEEFRDRRRPAPAAPNARPRIRWARAGRAHAWSRRSKTPRRLVGPPVAAPAMKGPGTSMVRPAKARRSAAASPLVAQRYHCRAPWKPVRANSSGSNGELGLGEPRQAAISSADGGTAATVAGMSAQLASRSSRAAPPARGGPGLQRVGPVARASRRS